MAENTAVFAVLAINGDGSLTIFPWLMTGPSAEAMAAAWSAQDRSRTFGVLGINPQAIRWASVTPVVPVSSGPRLSPA